MRSAILAFLLIATARVAHAQDKALVSYVDSVANAAVAQHRTPGVSVAVVKRGKTVLAKGYGFADLENDVPATAETVYRVGSITKQFTSAAIMRLAEQGKLSIDDTLQKFLPSFPTQGNRVTIRLCFLESRSAWTMSRMKSRPASAATGSVVIIKSCKGSGALLPNSPLRAKPALPLRRL